MGFLMKIVENWFFLTGFCSTYAHFHLFFGGDLLSSLSLRQLIVQVDIFFQYFRVFDGAVNKK